jgi:hypothetical protein
MSYKSVIVILFLVVITISQCKKDSGLPSDNPFGLPNATQTGEGIFAFRMNNANYSASNDLVHLGGIIINDTVAIKCSVPYGRFFVNVFIGTAANARQNITYNLSDTIHTYCYFVTDSTCQQIGRVVNFKPKSGQITLTKIDSVQRIISGTFKVSIPVPNCDSLIITDGRFDYKYYN